MNSYKNCRFRKYKSSDVVDFLPGQILSYRYDNSGKFYVTSDITTNNNRKTVFLECLIKGKANIYFMRDQTDHYYIQKEGEDLIELSEIPQLIQNEEGFVFYKIQKYTGKLKYILRDCPSISNEIDKIKLNSTQLIQLAKHYHDKVCDSEQCIIYEKQAVPVKVSLSLYAGIVYSNFHLSNTNYSDNRVSVYPGFRVEIKNFIFSDERIKILTGFSFHHFSNYTFHLDADWDNTYVYHNVSYQNTVKDVDLNASAFRIPVSVNYSFSLSKFQPYLGVGFSNLVIISQNKNFYLNNIYDYYGQSLPTYSFGFVVDAGINFKLNNKHYLFFDLNFEPYQNFNINSFCRLQNQFISSQFGIIF